MCFHSRVKHYVTLSGFVYVIFIIATFFVFLTLVRKYIFITSFFILLFIQVSSLDEDNRYPEVGNVAMNNSHQLACELLCNIMIFVVVVHLRRC